MYERLSIIVAVRIVRTMTIAERIDIARVTAGFKNQAELARAADVNESTLARILKGGVMPSIEIAAKIATTCNVSLDWIVDLNTNTKPDHLDVHLTYVTQEELTLLTKFRRLSGEEKEVVKSAFSITDKSSLLTPNQP